MTTPHLVRMRKLLACATERDSYLLTVLPNVSSKPKLLVTGRVWLWGLAAAAANRNYCILNGRHLTSREGFSANLKEAFVGLKGLCKCSCSLSSLLVSVSDADLISSNQVYQRHMQAPIHYGKCRFNVTTRVMTQSDFLNVPCTLYRPINIGGEGPNLLNCLEFKMDFISFPIMI